jgi:glycerol-3-phosphate O-acyltransferase
VLGGDSLCFWPIGRLAKRRHRVHPAQFGDNDMNKLALRDCLGCLLAKRFTLKWYMQSGRSRTGKPQPTRYGLLAYLAEAVERGRGWEVRLVPVSITYDQL